MNVNNLKVPKRGFTKSERKWLAQLVQAIKTVHGIAGHEVTISEDDSGQTINANDCAKCP